MKQREEEMRSTNESTNSRVLYFSIFSMLCLGMCFLFADPLSLTNKSTANYIGGSAINTQKKSVWQHGKFFISENSSNQRNSSNNFIISNLLLYLWCWRRPNTPIIILESFLVQLFWLFVALLSVAIVLELHFQMFKMTRPLKILCLHGQNGPCK